MQCATSLGAGERRSEERRVVTIVFCDLVGFTARSELLDPEDVRAFLLPYYEVITQTIERHGGVIDKFLGDGVMAVFGAPIAHEDDPERAVRAALQIVERIPDLHLDLRVRIGVNTGEVLVAPADPERGDAITGDAANTASRLQAIAPEMGVLVGERTYELTAAVFDYEELEPASVKGKSEPLRIFWARASRARLGVDLVRTHDSPFVGRDVDLGILEGLFAKTVAESMPQGVTIVGEPGVGKSRLVAELGRLVDDRPGFVTWRQGRCLPYGDGITFWALGEIVKAHAGIYETDDPDVASAKLDEVLPEGQDRPWFRQRMLPLLGIEASSSAEREELFTAWRRFLEHIAEQDPTVLVFEDLHWADDAMLAFLDHLAERATSVPLLVVGTTRPELFERHPGSPRGLRDATSITLSPLSSGETAGLVAGLLDASVLPAELQIPIVERSGGNPLYVEELVRLMKDRDLLVRAGGSWKLAEGAEVPFPDSIHALIAARLDTLPPDRKQMLADASVVGKVFWAGAVAEVGGHSASEVIDAMGEICRKELVRPARRSTMQDEAEFAFWHVLTRDVSYAQIPRASRAAKHVAVATWLESKAGERVEDVAEVVADHYATALELVRATGKTNETIDLEGSALRFLILAGERNLGLDTTRAIANLERARALASSASTERPRVLLLLGNAIRDAGREDKGRTTVEEAVEAYRAIDDPLGTASALCSLSRFSYSPDPSAEALSILEPLPPGREHVNAMLEMASGYARSTQPEQMLAWADRALQLAASLGLPPPIFASMLRASAKCHLGIAEGIAEYRAALNRAVASGDGRTAAGARNNLGAEMLDFAGPSIAEVEWREGVEFATERGLILWANACQVNVVLALDLQGRFDEATAIFSPTGDRLEVMGRDDVEAIDWFRCLRDMAQGRADAAEVRRQLEVAEAWLKRVDPRTTDHDSLVETFSDSATFHRWLGEIDAARTSVERLLAVPRAGRSQWYAWRLPGLVRQTLGDGEIELGERLAKALDHPCPYGEHSSVATNATLSEARGELGVAVGLYADAAGRWERFGVAPEQGFALLGQGRCLLAASRAAEAGDPARGARAIFARCGMRPALEEADQLLMKVTAIGS